MTKEQARARITRLYEMIYYAQLMECKAAKITAQYYEETMEALEVAAEALAVADVAKMEVEQCQPKDDTSHPFADDVLMGGD